MAEQMFVARKQELAQLQTFLDRALAGQGTVCFVTGEAGAGKTALVTEFARRAQEVHPDLLVVIGNCNAQAGLVDPFLPFREVLVLLTGDVEAKLGRGAITPDNANRLQEFLRSSGQAVVEYGPDLIDIFVPGAALASRVGAKIAQRAGWMDQLEVLAQHKPAEGTGPEQSRIFEQYTRVLQALAVKQPLLLVIDDLHWVDASSAELLFHLCRRIYNSRIMILGLYRPEVLALGRDGERHPFERVVNELKRQWGDISVHLGPTDEMEGRAFIDALLDRQPNQLGENFRDALFQHTRGHPLFTIELLQSLQEQSAAGFGQMLIQDEQGHWVEGPDLAWDRLPTRVEAVIEERIGRLEEELRETLTVASVEGEYFTAQVLARVRDASERELARRLAQELDRRHRLIREQGVTRVRQQRLGRYRFRHALIQKHLYDSLSDMERMYLHEDVGNVLEVLYGDQAEEIAVQLAWHFQEAGLEEKAIPYLIQAGHRARRQGANEEAIGYFRRALAQIDVSVVSEDQKVWRVAALKGLGKVFRDHLSHATLD